MISTRLIVVALLLASGSFVHAQEPDEEESVEVTVAGDVSVTVVSAADASSDKPSRYSAVLDSLNKRDLYS